MKLQNYIDKNAYANDGFLFFHRRLFSLMQAEGSGSIDVFEEDLRPVGWPKKQFVNTLLSYIKKYNIEAKKFEFSGDRSDAEFEKWFRWVKSNIDTESGNWVGEASNFSRKEAAVNLSSGTLNILQNDFGLVDLSHVGNIDNFGSLEIDESQVEYIYENASFELSCDPKVAEELNEVLAKYVAKFEREELVYTPHNKYLNIAKPEIHLKVIRTKLVEKFSNYGNNFAIRKLETSFAENNVLFVHSLLLAVGHDLIEQFYIEASHDTGDLIAKNIKINELRVKARKKYSEANPKDILLGISFSEGVIRIGDYELLKPQFDSPAYIIANIIEDQKNEEMVEINRDDLSELDEKNLDDKNFSKVLTHIGFKNEIKKAFAAKGTEDRIELRPKLTKERLDGLNIEFEDLIEKLEDEAK